MVTLAQLEEAIRESWSADTSSDPDWSPANPSRAQCDITALVVHDYFGGKLLSADVYLDGPQIEFHMWNRLPSGTEIDLTRDQFNRGEVVGEPRVRVRRRHFAPDDVRYGKYLVLAKRVRARLGSSES